MKKFTILFFILLASTAFSQVSISIPGVTHAGYQTTPINTGWGYSRSAAIYLPGEINKGGQIIRVGWQSITPITDSIPVKIYMINTSQNNWGSNWSWSDVMSMVGLQTVFNGIIGPTFQLNFDVVLQTSFLHDSTKSLYVIVETNYGGTGSVTSPPEFSVSNPTAGHQRHLTWSSNNTPPAGTVNSGFYNPIPLVRLSFSKETGTAVSSQNVYTRCGYDSLKWTNNTNNDSVIVVVAHTGKKPYLVNGVKYQPGTLIDYVIMPGPSVTGDTVIFRGKASSLTHIASDLTDKTYYF